MIHSFEQPHLILASKSPRRSYLLRKAGLVISVIPSTFDESSVSHPDPEEYVRILAEAKASDVASAYPESWVIGADTVVVIDGQVLGKPVSSAEAGDMLLKLSGKTHAVLTGYCICCSSPSRSFSQTVRTEVTFKSLSNDEINWYIDSREPFDKAGAYAIQGLGTFLVKRINGSYTNVVGLPVCEVIEFLIKEGIIHLKQAS